MHLLNTITRDAVKALWIVSSTEAGLKGEELKEAAKDALKRMDDTNYDIFEDYKKVRSKVWIIEETEHDFFCNCFIGLKGKIC